MEVTMDKQTSIEWLIECLNIHLTEEQKTQFEGLFQQAKQMHKEEIVEAYKYGNLSDVYFKPEQYYQETYGGENGC